MRQTTTQNNTDDLRHAVEGLHDCQATYSKPVTVSETFSGDTVWEGVVHIFDLKDHPTASICYAWSSPVEGSDKRKFYAVLHQPLVTSPEEAVRAAIVKDFKDSQ